MLDKIKFAKLMVGLGEIYDKQISEFVADMYYETMKEYDYGVIESAVKKVICSHKYNTLPKPADILDFIIGSKDDKALQGWLWAKEAVRKGGQYASVVFSDPLVAVTIQELGGWQWLCDQEKDQIPFVQKRFMDIYRLLEKRGDITEKIRLIGTIEAQNSERGFVEHIPEPLEIGHTQGPKKLCVKQEV